MLNKQQKIICENIIKGAIEYCNNDLYSFKRKKLAIEFELNFKNTNFNAGAYINKNPYKIYYNASVFENIFKLYNTLFNEGNHIFFTCVSNRKQYDLEIANLYLDLLFEVSSLFVIFHELGHIFEGHVDYMYDRKQITNFTRQAIEMDADAFAANRLIGQLTFNSNIAKMNNGHHELIQNKPHAFIICSIGACIAFSFLGLGRNRYNVDDLDNLQYLPLRTRQDYFNQCAINAYKQLNNEETILLGDQIIDIIFLREVLPNIEQYVNLYFRDILKIEPEYDSSNNCNELNEVHLQHCQKMNSFVVNSLGKELSKYNYFEII